MQRIDQRDLAAAYTAALDDGGYLRHGADAPSVRRLTAELWRYAFPTLLSMMASGDIREQLPYPLGFRDDEIEALTSPSPATREDLAVEIITDTFPSFFERELGPIPRDRVVTRWDSERSGLGTWFVGACRQQAHAALRRWVEGRRRFVMEFDRELLDTDLPSVTFEGDVVSRDMVRMLVTTAPRAVRPILSALSQGDTIESAAQEMGISGAAARKRLLHYRKKKVLQLLRRRAIDLDLVPAGHKLRTIVEDLNDDIDFDWERPIDNIWSAEDLENAL